MDHVDDLGFHPMTSVLSTPKQKNPTRMFPSSPLLETVLEGPLMADPSSLDAHPIICQEDIDSPPLPPPIRWG
ncbi:hypothetical protein CDAR_38551 [Caerostris darwini]|uniref:Uncharacterized protein n=1 Tax=Caerostris darwini TaxID=1538125 RepID=A0AAV4URA3_9ARAC|nr:hypothetical protein CDAR_38551 [Caerostris darwini]